ncbi:hypothetical protein ACFB49_28620 [Sphingomonas sp. DBB INV C78]|uniref:hypothetical protein n=1 Tax=Sphingomonas sp. DBB INV C78 TaxID=3349434 RepID=UPI0036D3F9A7
MAMGRTHLSHPDQLPLELSVDGLEREIEARVAARCEAESVRWKFRLVAIETVMMGALVAAAGIALDQPGMMVARAAVLVAASCFASGLLLLGLSAWSARLLTRFKRWRAS